MAEQEQPGTRPVPSWAPRFTTVVLLTLVLLWLFNLQTAVERGPVVSYTTLVELVEADAVSGVTLDGTRLQGTLRVERPLRTVGGEEATSTEFVAQLPSADDPSLLALLHEHGVEVTVAPPAADRTWWWSMLLGVAPFLLLFGFWIWIAMRMRGAGPDGLLSIGRSGARLYDHTREQITFDDVAGARGAKQELREIIDFLRTPERFRRLGAEIPRGVLLVGPPGTGKTLLAKAVAGEAGVPFFSITGSDFLEMFVGVGPKRVRDLFESAKAVAPSIIFIDELDAIGGRRGLGIWSGGTDERERTLNQLLSEMSGFEPNENVIVMAATNRPDVLDAALLRPGRFDRRIMVDLPVQEDREQILRLHARHKPLAPDVDLATVAAGTPGFSGADLRNLLNEAAILAAREGANAVRGEHIEKARDKILMGLEREGLALTERERKFLSYHEAGHAVLAAVLPHTDPLHKVTIVPRGRAMGVTQQLPEREKYVYEREYILDRIVVMMGGRAAEEIVFQTATSGAEDDLRQASMLVRRMVQDWGMSDALGPFVAERPREQPFLGGPALEAREYSDATARRVDEAVEHILDESYDRALETLRAHREDLDRVAARLLEVEELSGEEVGTLLRSPTAGGEDSPRARPPGDPPRSPGRRRTSRWTT